MTDAVKCVTPNGRTDGHGKYVKGRSPDGRMLCAFCCQPLGRVPGAAAVSLKQAAWTYGCAKKGSAEEKTLLERLWFVIEAERAQTKIAAQEEK